MIKPVTWILGIVLLAMGIIGFFNNPVIGLFEVDTIHNIIHLVSGLVAIGAVLTGESYARLFLIVFGIVYAIVAVIGFVGNGNILGIFTTNRADDYLHTAIALVSLSIGFKGRK